VDGESIEAFGDRIRKIVTRHGNNGQELILEFFISGLPQAHKLFVVRVNPLMLNDKIAAAKRYEGAQASGPLIEVVFTTQESRVEKL
jgi:hypothetical protein